MIPYFSFSVVQFGPISLQVWGFFASLGILFALLISLDRARKRGIENAIIYDICLIALISMIAGAKLFYILFSPKADISMAGIFARGGFSFFGGMAFSAAAVYSYLKYKKMDVLRIADILAPGFAFALIFIRIGCFLVYDHVGGVTDLPWGIAYLDGSIRHPVSLYLIFGNIVIFFIIWYLEKRKTILADGTIFFVFFTLYSVFRFMIDLARCSDLDVCELRYFGFTYTQLLLLAVFPVSVHIINKLKINKKNE